MTVYIKSGGAWRAASNGGLYIKSGGAWRVASFCHIKSGGAWRDSGYRGYPLAPTDIYINGASFSSLTVNFAGPGAGGAPVSRYLVQELDSNGTPTRAWYNTDGYLPGVSVSEDQRLQYRVLSESASGLQSGWYGPIANRSRIQIGHSTVTHLENRTGTQTWSMTNDFSGSGCHRDQAAAPGTIPSGYYMTNWRHQYGINFGISSTYLSKPPAQGNRQIYYWNSRDGDGGAPWDISARNYSVNEAISNVDGQGLQWGIACRGIGWTPLGNDSQVLVGAIGLDGFYYYGYTVTITDRNYLANAFW